MPLPSIVYKILAVTNATLSVMFIFSNNKMKYSLHKMVNIFILFFMVLANAVQFSHKSIVTSIPISFSEGDYELIQFLTLLTIIIFNIFYFSIKIKMPNLSKLDANVNFKFLLYISLFSTIAVLLHYRDDLLHLYIRAVLEDTVAQVSDSDSSNGFVEWLLFEKIIRTLPFVCYILAANYGLKKKEVFILLGLMTIALFPTGLARNAIAMYWLPVLFYSTKLFERSNFFVGFVFLGLLVIFPFLECFRYWTGSLSIANVSLDYLNSMNFEASQEMMVVIKQGYITYGKQLLGVLFFFVPRMVWESKPIGSGAFIADKYDVFSNISMPIFAEGYINFGFVGILLFTLGLAYFCARCDYKYWKSYNNDNTFKPYYFVLIGAILFILRGDLMSSFAYTLATIIDIYIISRFLVKKA